MYWATPLELAASTAPVGTSAAWKDADVGGIAATTQCTKGTSMSVTTNASSTASAGGANTASGGEMSGALARVLTGDRPARVPHASLASPNVVWSPAPLVGGRVPAAEAASRWCSGARRRVAQLSSGGPTEITPTTTIAAITQATTAWAFDGVDVIGHGG